MFSNIDLDVIWRSLPYLFLDGMRFTLMLTALATAGGVIIGTLLAMMRLSSFRLLNWFAQGYVTIFRSIPLVMVLLWFFLIIPQVLQGIFNLSPATDLRMTSALVAFALFEAAYYSEIIRAGIQSVSRGQMFAAQALGMTYGQSMRLVILPQAFRAVIAPLGSTFIALIKNTTIAVVIGVTTAEGINESSGLMRTLIEFNGDQTILIFAVFALGFVIITLPVGLLTSWAARRLGGVR